MVSAPVLRFFFAGGGCGAKELDFPSFRQGKQSGLGLRNERQGFEDPPLEGQLRGCQWRGVFTPIW